jgi:hypothetical protein
VGCLSLQGWDVVCEPGAVCYLFEPFTSSPHITVDADVAKAIKRLGRDDKGETRATEGIVVKPLEAESVVTSGNSSGAGGEG